MYFCTKNSHQKIQNIDEEGQSIMERAWIISLLIFFFYYLIKYFSAKNSHQKFTSKKQEFKFLNTFTYSKVVSQAMKICVFATHNESNMFLKIQKRQRN